MPSPATPSRIVLTRVNPLGGTMQHAEAEQMAALVVRVCEARGDNWQPVSLEDVVAVWKEDAETKRQPGYEWSRCPFFRPDPHDLVARGFARWLADGRLELTTGALLAMWRWCKDAERPERYF